MELREMRSGSIVLGFISSFLFLKPYANNLVSEISQLCYGGILRSISLSTTDGLSTFECYTIFVWQPIIVPVGKLSLGRILNVVGSSIDSFTEINLSCMF
jgi:F-type H+-transporting ATPase subunit beta